MALAAESPRPFSFHAPVCPALAQPQLAVRLLADRQVDHKRLAFALVRPALGPELHLHRQAAWLEVYWRQAAHALFRLAPRRDLQHHSVACQVGRSPVVLGLGRDDRPAGPPGGLPRSNGDGETPVGGPGGVGFAPGGVRPSLPFGPGETAGAPAAAGAVAPAPTAGGGVPPPRADAPVGG